ncbi:MAG: DUF4170 domain-containing protein [Hyphomicrobiales bacterium]|nr:DUF4170 domain-containing protein [Hyphomicrobiales bacterium]
MHKQFWVIGADYGSIEFTDPVAGSTRVHGPFGSYEEAMVTWRERASESRHRALTRYVIVANAGAPVAA